MTATNCDVLTLPYITTEAEDLFALMDSELVAEILAPVEDSGIVYVTALANGYRQLTNSKHPINSLEDCQGLKIRCPQAETYTATLQALGAAPASMDVSELFTGLQTGVVDGQEMPFLPTCTRNLGEVQEYFATINYMYDPALLCAGKQFWDSLSDEHRDIIKQASQEAAVYEREILLGVEQEMLEEQDSKYGIEVTTPELGPFIEATADVRASYRDQDILNRVLDFVDSLH
jgi:TRAP-type C4-dicarboxylate transport system substrate-binding protein